MKIDHIFICVKAPKNKVKLLTDFGLTEGEPNMHTGQGTSNCRFFFNNIYFQLLHVTDEALLGSIDTKPSSLFERFNRVDDKISPYGICLYTGQNILKIQDHITKEYHPKFIHPPLKMHIFDTPLIEPMYYFVDYVSDSSKQTHITHKHEIGFDQMTGVTIYMPNSNSKIRQNLHQAEIITFKQSDTHLLELEFDDLKQGKQHDFRPDIPLIIKY